MNWLDSHCHINDAAFRDDLNDVLESMKKNNVTRCNIISSYLDDYEYGLGIKDDDIEFIHSLGVYPGDVDDCDDEVLKKYYEIYKTDECKAIGEIGLDYHWNKENREKQLEVFKKQIMMAKELDKPIIVHSRDAIQDTYNMLEKNRCRGVLHCYSDSANMAKLFVKLGYYISISGTVTWKNAREPLEVIRTVPLDRLLIETDCPYLTPEPNRGKRNDPSNVMYVGKKIASELGLSEELLKMQLNDNYNRLFSL